MFIPKVCPNKKHTNCSQSRTVNEGGKPGQGRPLGFLAAWVANYKMKSRKAHKRYAPSKRKRARARKRLKANNPEKESTALMRNERNQYVGEDSEPEEFK